MILNVPNILSKEDAETILETLGQPDSELWIDGAETAFGEAKKVKHNLQCDAKNPIIRDILEKARLALLKNTEFMAAARPAKFSRLFINAYEAGMSYGRHLDAPYIKQLRSDISMTLFLTPPESYEGGNLVLQTPFAEMAFKGPQGSVFIYPSSYLHEVEQVTSGTRIAIVGWLKSQIRHPHQREILYDLDKTAGDIGNNKSQQENFTQLLGIRNRLLREWGD